MRFSSRSRTLVAFEPIAMKDHSRWLLLSPKDSIFIDMSVSLKSLMEAMAFT